MTRIRTIIADDEAVAREGLRDMLRKETDIDVVAECADGGEVVQAIQEERPDLVFLDVQMPVLNGFEALRRVGTERLPVIIFVTAYDQYALRAFDVHAVDYLLKPFTDQRLHEAIEQARKHLENEKVTRLREQIAELLDKLDSTEEVEPPASYLERIPVRWRRRVSFIDVDDIDWMEAADNYVTLHVGEKTHLIRTTLQSLEEQVDPEQFVRVHRSYIVNVERIREVHPRGSGDCLLVLDDGTELLSSRTYSDRRNEVLSFPP